MPLVSGFNLAFAFVVAVVAIGVALWRQVKRKPSSANTHTLVSYSSSSTNCPACRMCGPSSQTGLQECSECGFCSTCCNKGGDKSICLKTTSSSRSEPLPVAPPASARRPTGRRVHQSRASMAGLQFDVDVVELHLRQLLSRGETDGRLGGGAPIYLTAVLEYLSAEVSELAGNAAKDDHGREAEIQPSHILKAFQCDKELQGTWGLDSLLLEILQAEAPLLVAVVKESGQPRLRVSDAGVSAFLASSIVPAMADDVKAFIESFVSAVDASRSGICDGLCGEEENLLSFLPYSAFWSRSMVSFVGALKNIQSGAQGAGAGAGAGAGEQDLQGLSSNHRCRGIVPFINGREHEQAEDGSFLQEIAILDVAIKHACLTIYDAAKVTDRPSFAHAASALTVSNPALRFNRDSLHAAVERVKAAYAESPSSLPRPNTQLDTRCLLDLELAIGELTTLQSHDDSALTQMLQVISENCSYKTDLRLASRFVRAMKLVLDLILREILALALALQTGTEEPTLTVSSIENAYKMLVEPLLGKLARARCYVKKSPDKEDEEEFKVTMFQEPFPLPLDKDNNPEVKALMLDIVGNLSESLANICVTHMEHNRRQTLYASDLCQSLAVCASTSTLSRGIGALFAHCLKRHLHSSPSATTSVIGTLTSKGLVRFHVMILRNMALPTIEQVVCSLECATKREKAKLLEAFGGSGSSGSLGAVAQESKQAEEEPRLAMPTDPNNWLAVENERRKQFALPTETLPDDLKQHPFFELYDAFSKEHHSLLDTPVVLPLQVEDELLLTNTRPPADAKRHNIVSADKFEQNWNEFTGRCFDGVDLSNCFIAGGSVLGCLLPNQLESGVLLASDIDVFIYGLSPEAATARVVQVLDQVAKRRSALAKDLGDVAAEAHAVVSKTAHAITLVGTSHFRPVQFILRAYRSPSEILLGFDVDCCSVGRSSTGQVFVSPRAWRAIATRVNVVDLTRRSPSYEKRLEKYSRREFAVFAGNTSFRKRHVCSERVWISRLCNPDATGLVQMLYTDQQQQQQQQQQSKLTRQPEPTERKQRKSSKHDGGKGMVQFIQGLRQDPELTCDSGCAWRSRGFDYANLHVEEVESLFESADDAGEQDDVRVIKLGPDHSDSIIFAKLESAEQLLGCLTFEWLTENPGRQGTLLTGSFQPLEADETEFLQESLWRGGQVNEGADVVLLLCGGTIRYRNERKLTAAQFKEKGFASSSVEAAVHALHFRSLSDLNPLSLCANDAAYLLSGCVIRVLMQIHPYMQYSNAGLSVVCELLKLFLNRFEVPLLGLHSRPIFGNFGVEAGRRTMCSREVQSAVRLALPLEIAKHAVSEGTKAVTKYQSNSW